MSRTRIKLFAAGLLGAVLAAVGIGSLFAVQKTDSPGGSRPSAREVVTVPVAVPKPAPAWVEKHTFKHSASVNVIAFGAELVAAGDADGNIILWNAGTGREEKKVIDAAREPWVADWLGFDAKAEWLCIVHNERNNLSAFPLDPKERFLGFGIAAKLLGTSADGGLCYCAGAASDKTLTFLEHRKGRGQVGAVAGEFVHTENVTLATMSGAGAVVATLTKDGGIHVWDYTTKKELWTENPKRLEPVSLALAPGGQWLAVGGKDGTVRVFDTKAGKETAKLTGHAGTVSTVAFDPDGLRILSGGDDKTVRVWDVKAGKELAVLNGHAGAVKSVAFGPDGKLIASGSADKTVKVWEAKP
jgi:WD40 repeat protein